PSSQVTSSVSSRSATSNGAEWKGTLGLLMRASSNRSPFANQCKCGELRSIALDGGVLASCQERMRANPEPPKNILRLVCRDTIFGFDHCFIVCYGRDGRHIGCRGGPNGPGWSPNRERPPTPCETRPPGLPGPWFGPLRAGCWEWLPGGVRRDPDGDTPTNPGPTNPGLIPGVFPDTTPIPDPVFAGGSSGGNRHDYFPKPAKDVKRFDIDDVNGSLCECIQRQIRYYDCKFWYGNLNSNSIIGSALRCCLGNPSPDDFRKTVPGWVQQSPGFDTDLGCAPR
ncbi:MAG: hypothetical protein ACK5XN_07225, partial [Bacteroidota bacterium]